MKWVLELKVRGLLIMGCLKTLKILNQGFEVLSLVCGNSFDLSKLFPVPKMANRWKEGSNCYAIWV